MRFGVALENFTPPGKRPSGDSIIRMAALAESLGFDSVWVWDHILLGSKRVYPILDSLTTLAVIGAKTTRIKLGTGILVMPLRNPLVLAKTVSTMQFLNGGRLILGCAAGWYDREFRAVGIDYKKRGKVFEEGFELLRKILTETDVNYRSERHQLEHVTMEPRPEKTIPMLIGGRSDPVLERCGRLADGWVASHCTPEDYVRSWDKIAESAKKSGRDPKSLRRVNIVPLAIGNDFESADREVSDFTARYMHMQTGGRASVESAVRGTVKECVEQIRKYESIGVDDLVLMPKNYDEAQIERAGKEILPHFIKK